MGWRWAGFKEDVGPEGSESTESSNSKNRMFVLKKKCSHGKETEQSRAFSSTALEQTLYYVILCLFLFPPLDVFTFK